MRFWDVARPPCVSVHGPSRYGTPLVYLKGARAHFLGPEATPTGFQRSRKEHVRLMMPMLKKKIVGGGNQRKKSEKVIFYFAFRVQRREIFGFWTFWIRPPHVWVVAPALEESKVLRKNTEKVLIFLKNAILGRRWAPVCVGA